MRRAFLLFLIALILVISEVRAQDPFLPPGYEEVSKPPPDSVGALEKCGENEDKGKKTCVPYYMCDGTTKLIVQDGVTDGFGILDIRFGANSCDHPLDVCCGIPDEQQPLKDRIPDNPPPVDPPPVDPVGPPIVTPTPSPSPPYDTSDDDIRPISENPDRVSRCGIRNNNGIDFKITGNSDRESEYGEFPWMVAILKRDYNPSVDPSLSICGGSLIAPNIVLTGAHCVYKYKANQIKIRAGEWDTQTTKERIPHQERNVANIIIHNDFNSKALYNDIALLVLTDPVIEVESVGTICLPDPNQEFDSKHCFASGWGKDVFGKVGQYQVILKNIELPTVNHTACEFSLKGTRLSPHFVLHDSFMCAGGVYGKDTCTGDGGSPLVCPDPNNPARYVQAGIVAWGIGCGSDGIPGVYADVAKFRKWVDNHVQRLNFDTNSYTV